MGFEWGCHDHLNGPDPRVDLDLDLDLDLV